MLISEFQKADEFINLQNKIINDNITYRQEWENDCKQVMMSYQGNKFPVLKTDRRANSTSITKNSKQPPYLNMIKRQYRTTANYLLNNEPQFLITAIWKDVNEWDLVAKRVFLENVFEWATSDKDEVMWFYDTVMDDVIYYGMFRGLSWTMVYYDKENKSYEFRSFDSMDTFIDLEARSLRNIQKIVFTYTKNRDWLKKNYPTDPFWKPIDWDLKSKDQRESKSDVKQAMLKDKPDSDTFILREGYYLENDSLVRIITTEKELLVKEIFENINFLPFTYFTPMNEPESLYPKGWYVDMLNLDREINLLVDKINKIIKTWWRYVYVKEWTKISKGTSNFLNSLDIEVIEISDAQELPQQATLLQVSQADLQHLDFLMRQAEEEWGMKSDIMGTSSLWADASWRAIQALQAWSKNNIWPVLNELNKYMNRLVKVIMKLNDIYWEDSLEVMSEEWPMEINKKSLNATKTKVSITWRDAFDEVTKQIQGIQILDYITKFNPQIQISPETITSIFWVTNDIATKIQADIDKQENPDIQIAEWENKKLMNAIAMNADQSEDHNIHMALHTELLKNFPPESDAGQAILNHVRMHEAFMQSAQ